MTPPDGRRPPPPPKMFAPMSVALGIVTAFFLPVLTTLLTAPASGEVAIAAFVAWVVGVPVWAIVRFRGDTRQKRGWGLGLLLGWGTFLVVGGGTCITLLGQL